jgi:4'-phosphopantetheinyl transferase EntD
MSKQEIESCDLNSLKDLYYFWCAKEAMYKWYTKKNLDFIEDLQVDMKNRQGVICKEHTLQLMDFFIEDQFIVVCDEEEKPKAERNHYNELRNTNY